MAISVRIMSRIQQPPIGLSIRRRFRLRPVCGYGVRVRRVSCCRLSLMRSLFRAAIAAFCLAVLAGCAPQRAGGLTHPNLIAVREFAFSTGVVTLDPSFGFSLYRGSPGVPPRQRAEAVGRAAGF